MTDLVDGEKPYVPLELWFSKAPELAIPACALQLQLTAAEKHLLKTVGQTRDFSLKPMTPFELHRFETNMQCPCGCAVDMVQELWDRYVESGRSIASLVDAPNITEKGGFEKILELYLAGKPVEACLDHPQTQCIIRGTLEMARDWIEKSLEGPTSYIVITFGVGYDVAHAVLCWLDNGGLVEHGTGIRGAWITNTGRAFLQSLQ